MSDELSYLDDGVRLYRWDRIAKQDEVWIDRGGREHRIADMDPEYRRNAFNWFAACHAPRLLFVEQFREVMVLALLREGSEEWMDGGLEPWQAEADALFDLDALDWARQTPLGRALCT